MPSPTKKQIDAWPANMNAPGNSTRGGNGYDLSGLFTAPQGS